jgi:hypothetical protein
MSGCRPFADNGIGRMVELVNNRVPLANGVLMVGLVLAGCGSGSSSPIASPTSSPTTAPSATAAPPGSSTTTPAVTAGVATCPTLAQANAALGVSDSGPIRTPAGGGGIVCEYTAATAIGNAGVTIFAHQSAAVFAGQVANAGRAPGMQQTSGVGDGAFALTTAGRSIVNAYADGSRTFVAAQAPGALAPVEALARVALADN